jgi:hypothetical protein
MLIHYLENEGVKAATLSFENAKGDSKFFGGYAKTLDFRCSDQFKGASNTECWAEFVPNEVI